MDILVLNPGSSSLKFGVYRMPAGGAGGGGEAVVSRGEVEKIGTSDARMLVLAPDRRAPAPIDAPTASAAAVRVVEQALATHPAEPTGRGASAGPTGERALAAEAGGNGVHAVACRVVHGGARFTAPALVTDEVMAEIRALAPLAPLHNPADADVIDAVRRAMPGTGVYAVFDTAFHHTLPAAACTYALPLDICRAHGLRRYGFHGISHRFVSRRLLEALGREAAGSRLITCHLGNGASICALRNGRSVETSMGLTPLEGLVMGTRSGDVDPGLLLYLQREMSLSPDALDDLLNHKSGLAGLSGIGGDMRDVTAAAQAGNAQAELALDVFAHRVRKYIGAYAAILGGLDAIAFTGGIGEHSASMRQRICRDLGFLGIELSAEADALPGPDAPFRISPIGGRVGVWVVPTDEELQMAREVAAAGIR